MTAKIIKFPGQRPCAAEAASGELAFGGATFDVVIGLVDGDPSHLRNASVRADDSLADLHGVIMRLFGWDDAHNYYFSQGSCRYEDPLLFSTQDCLAARCRRIYCAADVPVGRVLARSAPPLFYMYNLTNGRELTISLDSAQAMEQFG
ncbi:IS1096 element passenger TnpR family protein [Adlercreutzia shanghongiae]|uniref:Plasmid pRiA4b Orf3-like domain-containing protein n=1 Tax=Adlercreutzia shanghongiae TaxID=3111773 RepID=A0ABU6IZW5_9ACTN|nr:hypothetical protein [Adlercreutzia sp. R22]MEC4295397.1 hypothetical protein [Adlercreutzia sp. R22]